MKYAKTINQLNLVFESLRPLEVLPAGVDRMMKHISRCIGYAEGHLSHYKLTSSDDKVPELDLRVFLENALRDVPNPRAQSCPECRSSRKATKRIQTRK
jgi:hypothetical protein